MRNGPVVKWERPVSGWDFSGDVSGSLGGIPSAVVGTFSVLDLSAVVQSVPNTVDGVPVLLAALTVSGTGVILV